LEFHYTANTFVAPEKARFKYRLVGLDDNWIDAESRRQASFTDLRPGDYRFELRARNHHGVWQETSAAVGLHLEPFYYQTWWFWGICATAGLAVAAMILLWRWRELHRIYELRRVSDLNFQRREIARDIHDELGASLTHILQLSNRLGRSRQGQENHDHHAERIGTIAGEAVDSIGEIVWANNPEYDTLEDLTAYLREHAASFFAESDIKLHLDFPESVPQRAVVGSVRRHIVLLLKEALQNVVKHARASEVAVRLRPNGKGLEMEVSDNGCGMPAEGGRKYGNGIHNMRDRVAQLRGTFELISQPGKGTEIRVSIPGLEL
jgi:signal transduction histidine kinase